MDRSRFHLPRDVQQTQQAVVDSLPPRIRILTLGDSNTGKSCLVKRFCERRFVTQYISTIGIDYGVKLVGSSARVCFWDVAGARAYYHVRCEFYRDAPHAVLLCYDVSQRTSFTALDAWLDELRAHADAATNDAIIYLVANKIDLIPRVVSPLEGQAYADARKLKYFECTSALGDSVDILFNALIADALVIHTKRKSYKSISSTSSTYISKTSTTTTPTADQLITG